MELTRRALLGSALAASATPAVAASQVMRIGITTSLVILDPLRTTLGDEYIYDNLVFNGLTRMNADLSVAPDLAESWTSTEDLKQWTFTLRRGVKFHNGREMVADDVVAGFQTAARSEICRALAQQLRHDRRDVGTRPLQGALRS